MSGRRVLKPFKAGDKIRCTVCHGTGYVIVDTWDGRTHPEECKGCGGTGEQTIRKPWSRR